MRTGLLLFAAVLLSPLSLLPAAEPVLELTLPEFVDSESRWSQWTGKLMRIEGRYSSFTPSAMRFQNCDVTFYLPRGVKRPLARSKTIEVTGELKRDGGDYEFHVDSLQPRPSEFEQLQITKGLLPKNDALPWYELGRQTATQAEFYDDDLLGKLATSILMKGLEIERSRQKNPTPEFLRQLAGKAEKLGLAETTQRSLLHDSYRLELKQAGQAADFSYAELRKLVESTLPGCLVPLKKEVSPEKIAAYHKQPQQEFATASVSIQQQLSRLLYLDILQAEFQDRLSPGGANGDQLAKEYTELAPDDPEFAEELREAALIYRSKNIVHSTRAEVLGVAEQYRQQGEEKMATTAFKKWLEHRANNLAQAGPSDYLQTALDFEEWLNNRKRAEEIALAGIKRYPNDAPLQALLARWEYVKQEGEWIPKDQQKMEEPDEFQQAIQAGRIVPGMTPQQVVSTLGAPRTMTQLASKNENLLIWKYSDVRLVIQFEQRHTSAKYTVKKVNPLP